jgi:hypothetical protein
MESIMEGPIDIMSTWSGNESGAWGFFNNWSGGLRPFATGPVYFDFREYGLLEQIFVEVDDQDRPEVGNLVITVESRADLLLYGSPDAYETFGFRCASHLPEAVVTITGDNSGRLWMQDFDDIIFYSNTNFHLIRPGSQVQIFRSNLTGSGVLVKSGDGTITLTDCTGNFTGGINLNGGWLTTNTDSALGAGAISISNNAKFGATGVVDNLIGTISNSIGNTGSATVFALDATTLHLTGGLSHISQGVFSFGLAQSDGVIVADFSSIAENGTNSSFRIDGGTLRMGNAFNAANLLLRPGQGITAINTGAVLDTSGYATTISNLALNGGTIRASNGALTVTVEDSGNALIQHSGTITGTASSDTLSVFAQGYFNLSGITFTSWSAGDLIQISGSGASNSLTGGNQRDTINGNDGNDTLNGNGGVDTISGGNDNDLVILNGTNDGSFVDGGNGTDTLRITGNIDGLGSFTGFEAIELQNNSSLTLTGAQFATGLSATATLSGLGVVRVNLSLADQQMNASSMTVTGSTLTFSVNGSSSDDVVQVATNSASEILGNGGNDLLVGSDLGDYIDGGSGINTVNGLGGNDLLVVAANGSGSFIDGGAGNDTLAVSGAVSLGGLTGIENIQLASGAALTLTGSQLANGISLFGTTVSGAGSLTVNMDPDVLFVSANFAFSGGVAMTVNGTSGTDIIKCGPTSHTINAGGGVDQIRGGTAADTINGGDGNDKIMGFGGADVMTGGAGADQFRYILASDSGLGAAADRITDFAIGQDILNFVLLDADAATAGDQAFNFIGTAVFTNSGLGQIRYTNSGADLLVQVDTDGNGSADMAIILQGRAGSTLTAADFVL